MKNETDLRQIGASTTTIEISAKFQVWTQILNT
jgi:hypothetical protein